MKKRFFVQAACGHCQRESTFKLIGERDASGRALMVCTTCGRRQPQPGEQERTAGV
ncbi:MAG: hypothetical protein JWN17_2535 [Frankiales bacterium]|nr:hypothetical protein [Frankiales bacterium]